MKGKFISSLFTSKEFIYEVLAHIGLLLFFMMLIMITSEFILLLMLYIFVMGIMYTFTSVDLVSIRFVESHMRKKPISYRTIDKYSFVLSIDDGFQNLIIMCSNGNIIYNKYIRKNTNNTSYDIINKGDILDIPEYTLSEKNIKEDLDILFDNVVSEYMTKIYEKKYKKENIAEIFQKLK